MRAEGRRPYVRPLPACPSCAHACCAACASQGRSLLLTNTEYLNTKIEKGTVTHGGAGASRLPARRLAACLLPRRLIQH
jgi:hypothetical protein